MLHHRIGDLEKQSLVTLIRRNLHHRIGDLEIVLVTAAL